MHLPAVTLRAAKLASQGNHWHPAWDLPILSNLSHGTVGWDGHQG